MSAATTNVARVLRLAVFLALGASTAYAQTDNSCEAKAAHILTSTGNTLAAKIRSAYPGSFTSIDDARLTAIFNQELPCLSAESAKTNNQWGGTFSQPAATPPPATPAPSPQPIQQSADRAAAAAATQPRPVIRRADDSVPYIVSGVSLLGAGVTLEILSYTALKHDDIACASIGYSVGCVEQTSTNIPVMVTGAVVALAGGILWDIGWHKHTHAQIAAVPGGFAVRRTVSWK